MGQMYFTEDHEWVEVNGRQARVGITEHASVAMGDIVYVELPVVDTYIEVGDACCVVESVKAAADVLMPISGKVIEVNERLEDEPEQLNEAPMTTHLFIVVDFDGSDLEQLMDEAAYQAFLAQEKA